MIINDSFIQRKIRRIHSRKGLLRNCTKSGTQLRGGTETNRQCFTDICKIRQSRFGSKSGIHCRIDALKIINTAQRHVDNKHRQLILPICTRFIANLALPTLADIGNALPISLCAVPNDIYTFNHN